MKADLEFLRILKFCDDPTSNPESQEDELSDYIYNSALLFDVHSPLSSDSDANSGGDSPPGGRCPSMLP